MSIMFDGVYVPTPVVAPPARLYWPAHDLVPRDRLDDPPMNAEFNWWLLIVGLVIGASLTWLVMADLTRRDEDVDAAEQAGEARWIETILTDAGRPIGADRVADVLRLHRDYLAAPPPDDPVVLADDDDDGPRRTAPPTPARPVSSTGRATTVPGEPRS
jgi:hypothetical protein